MVFAKEKSWDVEFNKKTRELQINIPKGLDFEGSNLNSLRYTTTNGDVNLEADKSPNDVGVASTKKGFIKNNLESRVNQRHGAPIQLESHGHSVLEVAKAYNFPEGDGEGQTIGIIELGGAASKSDIKEFFSNYNVEPPKIQVSGKPNAMSEKDDVEVTADVQVAGILAPKAKIVLYYGSTILEAMKRALSDTRNKLTVISISWAGSEFGYSMAELDELDEVFYQAALKGITVVAASGDNGAFNNKNFPNVSVPSIFSHVIGCGGTRLLEQDGHVYSETVWNESRQNIQIGTGGGFSQRVSLPGFQQRATEEYLQNHPQFQQYDQQKGRGVPDIAANAADATGYSIFFGGQWMKIGGTSLATPLWAALIARMNQNLGYNLGYFTPFLYELIGSDAFHPIVQGNNNLYVGAPNWNASTGLGAPNGQRLQEAIDRSKDQ